MKIAIMTDSAANMPQDVREKLDIHMIPLTVNFGQESYREEVDITVDEFYKKVREVAELPKTSQPSTGVFVEKFEELAKDYDAVISIHISSGLSGTYQGAVAAGEMVHDIEVHAFDSEIACAWEGFYAEEAAKLAAEGKSVEVILNRLEEMKKSLKGFFVVEDLSHLQRGGRVSSAQALFGNLLQLKPILTVENTFIVPFEKIRTFKKAKKRILELLGEVASEGKPMKAAVAHGNVADQAEEMKKQIEDTYPNVEVSISYVGPVVGTHLGEGAMGIGWYVK